MENLDWYIRRRRSPSKSSQRDCAPRALPTRFGTIFMTIVSLEADIKRRKA